MNAGVISGAHRLSRANYWPRSVGFAASFVVILLLATERGWSPGHLVFPGIYLLLYPHALVMASRYFAAAKRLEVNAMLADALVLGFMVTWIDFFLWLSFAFLVATVLNNVVVGGLRQLLQSAVLFVAGILLGAVPGGWEMQTAGPFFVEAIAMGLLLGYVLMVGFVAFDQNARLVSSAREIEERNRIFRALVEISASADLARDVEDFVNEALSRVHRIYPATGLGLVLRQANRPEIIRFAAFQGVPAEEQESLLAHVAVVSITSEGPHTWTDMAHRATFQLLFTRGRIRGNEGVIVVRTERIGGLLRESMGLFLELLGTTMENKLLAMELKHAAETDPLTGTFNRGYLDAELTCAIRGREQHQSMDFSVLLIDLVGLKRINDQYGHAAGDLVIRETAEALREVCRSTDVLVRYGGDEFVILCHGSNRKGAEGLLKRIEDEVVGRSVNLGTREDDLLPVPVYLSIGLASSSDTPAAEVLAHADADMYRKKEAWYATHARYR